MTIVVDWDYSECTLHYPAEVSWFVSSDSQPSPDMLLYHKNEKPAWASVTTHFLRQINVSVMDDLPYMICKCLTPNLNQNEYCRKYLKKRTRKLQLDNIGNFQNGFQKSI